MVFGVVALSVFLIAFAHPAIGLLALPFVIALSQPFLVGSVPIRVDDVAIGALMLAWCVRLVAFREGVLRTPFNLPMTFYVVYGIACSLWALMAGELSERQALFRNLKYVEYFLVFLLVVNYLRRMEEVKAHVAVALGAWAMSVAYGVYDFHYGSHPAGTYRLSGPKGDEPNIIGVYYLLFLLVAMGMVYVVRPWLLRGALVAAILLSLYAIAYTFSRTVYAALPVALVCFALLWDKRLLLLAAVAILLAPNALPSAVMARLEHTQREITGESTLGSSAYATRVGGWTLGIEEAMTHPLEGVGVGRYDLSKFEVEYATQAAERGLVGLGIFLWLLASVGSLMWRQWQRATDAFQRALMAGAFAGFIGYLMHGLGGLPFTAVRSAEAFWYLVGLVYVAARCGEREGQGRMENGEWRMETAHPDLSG